MNKDLLLGLGIGLVAGYIGCSLYKQRQIDEIQRQIIIRNNQQVSPQDILAFSQVALEAAKGIFPKIFNQAN